MTATPISLTFGVCLGVAALCEFDSSPADTLDQGSLCRWRRSMTDPGFLPPPGQPHGSSPGFPPSPLSPGDHPAPGWAHPELGPSPSPPGSGGFPPYGPGPVPSGYPMRGRSPYRRPMIRAAMRRRAMVRIAIGVFLLVIGIVLSYADAAASGGRVNGFLTVRWVLIVLCQIRR